MKNKLKIFENKLLPLTFKYLVISEVKGDISDESEIVYYIECDKYKTRYNTRREPHKSLNRLI